MPAFANAALLYQAPMPSAMNGKPPLTPSKVMPSIAAGVDLGVPAVLLVVGGEVHGLLRLDERRADLAAPDPPDVRALAAEQFGAQLVGIDRGAGAGQRVHRGGRAVLASNFLTCVLEQVDRRVVLVGEQRAASSSRCRCASPPAVLAAVPPVQAARPAGGGPAERPRNPRRVYEPVIAISFGKAG